MNCTIWRSTSTSAPFSASSANAIVEAVIVFSFGQGLLGRTSTLSGLTMATLYGLPRLKTYTTSWGITGACPSEFLQVLVTPARLAWPPEAAIFSIVAIRGWPQAPSAKLDASARPTWASGLYCLTSRVS